MVMNQKEGLRLYCFSPPVMMATFLIEIGGALWTLVKYKTDKNAKLIIAMLTLLAVFQLAEFMVCQGALGLSSLDWARAGYVAITFLPPLGIHLGLSIAGRKHRGLLAVAYGSAMAFALFFLFVGHGLQGEVCLGNYVIFKMAPYAGILYTLYYYGWLLTSVGLALKYRKKVKRRHNKKALAWLAGGYAAFIVPTTFVNIIDPGTLVGVPSIMCGFAVLLVLVLLFWVSPLVLTPRYTK